MATLIFPCAETEAARMWDCAIKEGGPQYSTTGRQGEAERPHSGAALFSNPAAIGGSR
jgi:hypothetical protein